MLAYFFMTVCVDLNDCFLLCGMILQLIFVVQSVRGIKSDLLLHKFLIRCGSSTQALIDRAVGGILQHRRLVVLL